MGKTFKDSPQNVNKDFRNKKKIKSKNVHVYDALSREIPIHKLKQTYQNINENNF